MNLKLTYKFYQLPLKHPFSISRYTVTTQKTVIVSITNDVVTGYGEATVNPYYNSTVDKLSASLKVAKTVIETIGKETPEAVWDILEPKLREDYFALCAVDCAYWDFYAKCQKRTLRSYWSRLHKKSPLSNFTIGIDSISNMVAKIKEMPWPVYKIKLGTSDDVAIVKALRQHTKAIFRVDANGAWTIEETIENSKVLKTLGVEFIEQPLSAEDWDGMVILKTQSVLPIIADESCQKIKDMTPCAEVFHGVNIKLMKCGGITPALKMIEMARKQHIKTMVGCMTESSVGISNLSQLAPLLDYIDADGALLLDNDTADGVKIENGKIMFKDYYGSGVLNLKSLNSYKGL